MLRLVKAIPILAILIFICAGLNFGDAQPLASAASATGYGQVVGDVQPCTAKRFDEWASEPLIVILTKNRETYDTYNVSADVGTTSFHFDVLHGRYTMSTTWWGAKDYVVTVRTGRTSRINIVVSCGEFTD